eukprot:COSAG03_NODE_10986_length_617_cov_211.907336_3_plen_29_part_01
MGRTAAVTRISELRCVASWKTVELLQIQR